MALLESRAQFDHEIIDLQKKPEEFVRLSPTGLVPLLQLDDGSVITESIPIARRVAVDFDQHVQLLPPSASGDIESFIHHWTASVEPAYYGVLRASSEAQVQLAVASFLHTLAPVEERLPARSEDGADDCFLLGAQFSLAEAVAAPWVERMLLMLPYWRGIDTLELCARHGLPKTTAWMRAVAARPSVKKTSAGTEEMARAARRYFVDYATPGTPGEVALFGA